MTTLRLYWHRHPGGFGNFGDELSPWLIRRLSPGISIKWTNPNLNASSAWRNAATLGMNVVRGEIPLGLLGDSAEVQALARQPSLLGIGSIIQRAQSNRTTVWGSGLLSRQDNIGAGRFLAVRGHLTRRRLAEMGLHEPEVVGDPALLVPLVRRAKDKKRGNQVGILPHHMHFPQMAASTTSTLPVVDLTAPIESVLDSISECTATLSTSLHGLIVSHAFGIPSLWIKTQESQAIALAGDGVKFEDYFSSVDIECYPPISLGSMARLDESRIRRLFAEYAGVALPERDVVAGLQSDLLKVAPFRIGPGIAVNC